MLFNSHTGGFFIRTLKKILIGIILFIVTLQVTCYIALQFPAVQTRLVKSIIASVEDNINGKINIDRIYIIFFNRIILRDVTIVSTEKSPLLDSLKTFHHQSDTLLSCSKLSVGFSATDLLRLNLKLTSVKLEKGAFNLQSEGDSSTNFDRIFKSKNPKQRDTTKKDGSLNLLAKSLRLKDFRFTLNNPYKSVPQGDSTINFADLDVSDINVNIDNIRFERDTIFARINNISGIDKSGFKLATLQGNLELSSTEARFNHLLLADSYSRIDAEHFSLKYTSPKAFSNFTDDVTLGIDMNDTYINFKTIGKITPTLRNSRLAFYLTGEVTGPVSNIRTNLLKVTSESGQTFLELNTKLIGLPDAAETMAFADIHRCYTTSSDVANIISSINNTPPIAFLQKMPPLVQYQFEGGFSGLLTDFVANGELQSTMGNVKLDMLLRSEPDNNGMTLKGNVQTTNLKLGGLLHEKMLGELSMKSTLSARVRSEAKGGSEIVIDSVHVDKLGVNGYNYTNIHANGKSTKKDFDGRIICYDPNLNFIFQGLFSFDKEEASKFNFYLDIPYANLAEMKIDTRDSISEVNIRATANFLKTPEGDIQGNIDIKNSGYINSKGSYNIGAIKLTSLETDTTFTSVLTSPFVRARYEGSAPLTSFIKKFTSITLYSKYNNFFDKKDLDTILHKKDSYKFFAQTFNTSGICELILPDLYIQDSTSVNVEINRDNKLDMVVKSGRLAIGSNYLKNLTLTMNEADAHLKSEQVQAAGVNINQLLIDFAGKDNYLDASIDFKTDSILNNTTQLHAGLAFINDTLRSEKVIASKGKKSLRKTLPEDIKRSVKINILNSNISFKGDKWSFSPSDITFIDSTIQFNKLRLFNGRQEIMADGFLSKKADDSLSVTLNQFDIGILNLFMKKSFNFEGYFTGNTLLTRSKDVSKLSLDLTGDSVYVFHHPVGKMKLMSKWNANEKQFNVFVNTKLDNRTPLEAVGYYKPDSKHLDVSVSLNALSLSYFEPFLSDIISHTQGGLSGDLRLHGPMDKLELDGTNCAFENFDFLVNFIQVPYRLNGPVSLDKNGIVVKNAVLQDQYGARGLVSGGLSYHYFQNIFLNTRVDFENLQCLNTREKDNEAFYGKAFASGSLLIKGPLEKLLLEANISSESKTSIHIPLSSSSTADQSNLLTFVAPPSSSIEDDPYNKLLKKDEKIKQPTELSVKMNMNITPQTEIMIEINKAVGDVIKANGTGLINMDINPSKGIFDIFGDYNISQGSYKFVFMGFAPKDFTIQPGGNINFNGGIANTTLNITAAYKTKASINTLIADTSSVSTRRTVDCELDMSGQLMNPELNFNIQIPDLDPTTKVRVESALNTPGKIQKQFLALLVSGGFIPDEQSGIANNTTLLYSNASEILSNQLNNVLQQLGIPLDLGLNYQPGQKGTNIFDVAVSTQLFNNRVLINGSIGNDPYSSNNTRDVIGNLDIEIKLDKNGRLRLDLFSHAADKFSNYLDDKQRSGVGFGYQQEFNNFKDLFRRKSKEQKEYEKERKLREQEHKEREKAIERAEKEAKKKRN